VLLTNYREFLLLKRIGGKTHHLEGFQLAVDEKSFWPVAAQPRKAADALGERFAEYLKRVLLHNAPLNNPKDVAFFLASYARDARVRVEGAANLPALQSVRAALEEALGMKFEAEKGEHFFRSTLVQTLFYGVFSAWVLWHKEKPSRNNDFDWKSAAWTLHVPMISALFHQVADPQKLRPLGLDEVLDWTAAALNRVTREEFFARFVEDHAVQYFYEPFLEAFDPELRKQLGVWYTPPEIVQYQVARVDAALRDKDGLNIPDGLADPSVFVLDPCCGTGAYLVEVLRKIEKTLKEEKGEGALAELTIKEAAQNRVFGFEIMPAPFVVAHLQMGLLLQKLAVPLDDAKGERAGIFLTNALTGWDENTENPQLKNWPELEAERAGAGHVKQKKPIGGISMTLDSVSLTVADVSLVVGTAPRVIGIAPMVVATVPRVVGTAAMVVGTVPRVVGTVPRVVGTVPRVIGTAAMVVEIISMVVATAPRVLGIIPRVVEMVPRVVETFGRVMEMAGFSLAARRW